MNQREVYEFVQKVWGYRPITERPIMSDQLKEALGMQYDAIGPLKGYRAWGSNLGMLASVVKPFVWPRDFARASCSRIFPKLEVGHPPHPAPADSCVCGFYAFSSLENLASGGTHTEVEFIGEVEGWGRVYPHEVGWRSEFARVSALYLLPVTEGDPVELKAMAHSVVEMARKYEVPTLELPKKFVPAFRQWLVQIHTDQMYSRRANAYRAIGFQTHYSAYWETRAQQRSAHYPFRGISGA